MTSSTLQGPVDSSFPNAPKDARRSGTNLILYSLAASLSKNCTIAVDEFALKRGGNAPPFSEPLLPMGACFSAPVAHLTVDAPTFTIGITNTQTTHLRGCSAKGEDAAARRAAGADGRGVDELGERALRWRILDGLRRPIPDLR